MILFSSACLSLLVRQSSSAISIARALSLERKSSTARDAVLIRPAALIRGARVYPMYPDVILVFFFLCTERCASFLADAASISAERPMRSVFSIIDKPYLTIIRFSSLIGITSAIVPMATRSAKRENISIAASLLFLPRILSSYAQISLNTTPTPASSLKGYSQSGLWGLITARASGRSERHS